VELERVIPNDKELINDYFLNFYSVIVTAQAWFSLCEEPPCTKLERVTADN